ncbi:MAG: divalent-cation tolerance protein CutA [Methanotrichaceae archaeon]
MTEFIIMLCTAPPGDADKIARALIEEKLAACVNVTQVRSYFVWNGRLSDEREELMIIKTEQRMSDKIKARIKELHTYELPEIIAIPIVGGDERYFEWIGRSIG